MALLQATKPVQHLLIGPGPKEVAGGHTYAVGQYVGNSQHQHNAIRKTCARGARNDRKGCHPAVDSAQYEIAQVK
jgi:hypothetical protein